MGSLIDKVAFSRPDGDAQVSLKFYFEC
jgi:hypothetical protein